MRIMIVESLEVKFAILPDMKKPHAAKYVDGFVFVVPNKNIDAYRKMASVGKKLWLKHGALDYKECMGDDLRPKGSKNMRPQAFPALAKAKAGETVWFSYITFRSKAHRDSVNAKVMKDPAMNDPKWANQPMPFEMQRMAYGGFKVVIG